MKKVTILGFFIATFAIALLTRAHAVDISIQGNGTGSQNSVTIQDTHESAVIQGNNTTINNKVDANASTGNNTVSGNNGPGGIKTGDATTNVNIQNIGNTNTTKEQCCTTTSPTSGPSPTHAPQATPTNKPGEGPTPTPVPGIGGWSPSPNNPSGPGPSTSGTEGKVLGLSATSGEGTASFFTGLAFLCLLIGSALLLPRRRRI